MRWMSFVLIFITAFSLAYTIKPGDTLTVDVYLQSGEIMSKSFIVDEEGYASVPYVGYVKVAGKNLKEITELIRERVKQILPPSLVVVYLSKPRPEMVYFYGQVSGIYDLSTLPEDQRRLSNVMALVGIPPECDCSVVRILRDGKVINVEFSKYLETGDMDYDPVLREGDIVYVPKPMYVGVFGWPSGLVRGGVYEIGEDTSLLEILARAGVVLDPNSLKVVKLFRGKKVLTFKPDDEEEMMRVKLENGDMVKVEGYGRIRVFVTGSVSKALVFTEKENPTLRSLLSQIGLKLNGRDEWEMKILRSDEVKSYKFRSVLEIPDEPLENEDVIVVKKLPQYVYFHGVITGRFDLSNIDEKDRRLSVLVASVLNPDLGRYGRFKMDLVRKVVVFRKGKEHTVDYQKYVETGDEKYDMKIEPGDEIYVLPPERVIVTGDNVKQGIYEIEEGETLFEILVKAGLRFSEGVFKEVVVTRDGTVTVFGYDEQQKMSDFKLEDGDAIRVKSFRKIRVYILGDVSKRIEISEFERPDLRKVVSLAGLRFESGQRYEIILRRDEKERSFTIESPEDLPDIPLEDGDTVYVKLLNPTVVYVGGVRSGVVEFSFSERADLRTLVYKLGFDDEDLVIFVSRKDETKSFLLKDVLKGKVNFELKNHDYVYITPYAFGKVRIYTGKGTFTAGLIEENEDLRNVLERYEILPLDPEDFDRIEIIRDGGKKVYPVEDVLMGKIKVPMKDGDFVMIVPKTSRVVYVTGDIGRVVKFEKGEDINEETLLAKLGIGEERVAEIKGEIRVGGVVKIRLKKEIRVYVYGKSLGSRMVLFGYNESPTMENFLVKLNLKFPSRNSSYSVRVYRKGEKVFERTISRSDELRELKFEFQDGDFVRIEPNVIEVYVFGNVKQGRYILPRGSKLMDLLVEMGGLPSGIGYVRILREKGEFGKRVEIPKAKNIKLEDGDVLIFGGIPDDFVYVFGDVSKPGPVFVGSREESLLEILALSGGLRNWFSKREVYVIDSDGKEKRLELDYKSLMNYKVSGGVAVYVPEIGTSRVYVLGAVLRPSVVSIGRDTTLLDVIMRAGGFSKSAVTSSVYVFRGGLKGTIEVYDMSWVERGKVGKNPVMEPGDIVFVPDNPVMTINEIISLITPMMNFVNSSLNLYKNMKGTFGW